MLHTDARFNETVATVVGEVESRTDAEIVVVAAERSGNYRDLARTGAFVCALLTLFGVMAVPFDVPAAMVFVDLLVSYALFAWLLGGRLPTRWLSSTARRRAQVGAAAAMEFHLEAVHATPRRTGLLVYVSALEGEVRLLPDVGLEEKIPAGLWHQARFGEDLDSFVAGLREVGELLATHVPDVDGAEVVDLPNAPRVR